MDEDDDIDRPVVATVVTILIISHAVAFLVGLVVGLLL